MKVEKLPAAGYLAEQDDYKFAGYGRTREEAIKNCAENMGLKNECRYCGHDLSQQEDDMVCEECNNYQGKTEEDE